MDRRRELQRLAVLAHQLSTDEPTTSVRPVTVAATSQQQPKKQPPTLSSIDHFKALVGKELGVSDWLPITQERVNAFADATGDWQWIHVDPERAKKESPFGGPIAHGFLTLSLSVFLNSEVIPKIEGTKMGVNYGLNKVRFMAPVMVGSKIRTRVILKEVTDVPGGYQLVHEVIFEQLRPGSSEPEKKPSCIAETVTRIYL
jgi:acyl dehydratase